VLRSYISAALTLACLAVGTVFIQGEEKATDKAAKPKADAPVDMVATVREWNSDKFAALPATFRAGHVTPRVLDEKAITRTDAGFVVQLPSKAPVPTPSIFQGKVYVGGGFHSKEFYCLDAQTGKLVWGVDLDDDGPTSAACQDGVIVFNTESCTIFALDADTGKQRWSWWLGDPLTSTPTIAGGKVFTSYPAGGVGVDPKEGRAGKPARPAPPCSHALAAFDLKTGKLLWQRWLDSDVMSAPVAAEKELYVTSFAGIVYKFNPEDGTILSAVKSRATSAPVVVGKEVYLTRRADYDKDNPGEAVTRHNVALSPDGRILTSDGKVFARKPAPYLDAKVQDVAAIKKESAKLDALNGFAGGAPALANTDAGLWNVGQGNVSSLQAFQGSRILNYEGKNFNCMGDECLCTDPVSGKTRWTFKLEGDLKKEGGFLAAPPAAAGGQLFLTTLKGEVLQMDPKEGKVTKRYKVGGQLRFQPAIENGKIYVGTQDGKVVCIDTGDKKFTGWPCWGGNAAHSGVPAEK
jgi:outer membrane protein assembly factor BamB